MAESKRISDLTPAEGITANDLLFLSSFVNQDNYTSRSAGLGLMALAMLSEFTFDDKLRTSSKNIVGAINELNEIESYSPTLKNATGTFNLRRNGKVVHVYGSLDGISSTATSVALGTIKFKSANSYGILQATAKSGAYNSSVGTVWIDTSGNVTLYKSSGTTSCYIFGTFICT